MYSSLITALERSLRRPIEAEVQGPCTKGPRSGEHGLKGNSKRGASRSAGGGRVPPASTQTWQMWLLGGRLPTCFAWDSPRGQGLLQTWPCPHGAVGRHRPTGGRTPRAPAALTLPETLARLTCHRTGIQHDPSSDEQAASQLHAHPGRLWSFRPVQLFRLCPSLPPSGLRMTCAETASPDSRPEATT